MAFLKAIGFIIPLMDSNYANYYTREVMVIVIREFQSPDEEMKKIVLKVVKQCVATDGVEPQYVRNEILPEFFRNFWVRRMALDRRNYKQVVETTVELKGKVGCAEVVARVSDDLKDESEPYRRMVMETVEHVIQDLGAADIDERLEEQLIDVGSSTLLQEQASDDTEAMLSGFGVVVNALGLRTKPYLPQICGTIKWRLNNKSASVRMQAAVSHSLGYRRDAGLRRGPVDGPSRCCAIRVFGRGVPRGFRINIGCSEGYSQCDRHVEDDAAHQRFAASAWLLS